jgi:hypothetical protein
VINVTVFAGGREQLCTAYPNKLATNLHDTSGEQVGLVAIEGKPGRGFSGDAAHLDAFPIGTARTIGINPETGKYTSVLAFWRPIRSHLRTVWLP